jgi:hypothetical protein
LALNSTVISVFAIIILSVLGALFRSNHHEFVGGDEDPENGPEVAGTIFVAVFIYIVSSLIYSWIWTTLVYGSLDTNIPSHHRDS